VIEGEEFARIVSADKPCQAVCNTSKQEG
jgi:hypothetical protein